MSIQMHPENGGDLAVVEVRGKLTKADYATFIPAFEQLIQTKGKQRVLLDMSGFQGWAWGAAWEDLKFGVRHFSDIEQLAIVGENRWQHCLAAFCKPFTKTQVRYFDSKEGTKARAWLAKEQQAA
ncbi:STAS/SEC14 domain-containing protein [Gallaecimonas pentaromativorans]|uniref:SpoIIAA-like protein n=1 Tax=Gallaecimonas pentaromativorans TaxID=584787 RepID=A0A3N1PUV9_9GAMM|nr:STAS/SEC14 domain-containing protein [Gallaecimonas pentaromativorans]ROQ30547.1 SpoIIAA-like protein [Gallaecimonas pentaromativorans]